MTSKTLFSFPPSEAPIVVDIAGVAPLVKPSVEVGLNKAEPGTARLVGQPTKSLLPVKPAPLPIRNSNPDSIPAIAIVGIAVAIGVVLVLSYKSLK